MSALGSLVVKLGLEYAQGPWSAGGLWRLVAAQHRHANGQGNVVGRDLGACRLRREGACLGLAEPVQPAPDAGEDRDVDHIRRVDRGVDEHGTIAGRSPLLNARTGTSSRSSRRMFCVGVEPSANTRSRRTRSRRVVCSNSRGTVSTAATTCRSEWARRMPIVPRSTVGWSSTIPILARLRSGAC